MRPVVRPDGSSISNSASCYLPRTCVRRRTLPADGHYGTPRMCHATPIHGTHAHTRAHPHTHACTHTHARATPRHATATIHHATPRHAMQRHATPRPVFPVSHARARTRRHAHAHTHTDNLVVMCGCKLVDGEAVMLTKVSTVCLRTPEWVGDVSKHSNKAM